MTATFPSTYGAAPIGTAAAYVAPAVLTRSALVVLSPHHSDAATIASGTAVSSLPVANLQSQSPKKKWRSTGTTDYVTLAFVEPIAANMLAIVGHNFSGAGLYRVRLAATLAGTTAAPAVDTGWQSVWPSTGKPLDAYWPNYLSALRWTNDSLYSFARVDFADPSPLLTYLEAGRLMLGRGWQPTINFDGTGTPLAFDQRDVQTVTDYSEIFTDRRQRSAPRRMSLQISALDKRETLDVDAIADIQRLRGGWGDVVVLLDPDATTDFHRQSMQGVFTSPQEHPIVPQFTENGEMWVVNFPLREV